MLEINQVQGPDGMMALIEDVNQLVSVSDIYYRLEAAIENPSSSVQDYARLLSVDPDLCARLLRVANSAFYSFAVPVESVERAIQRVGLRPIRELVLATTILESFSRQSIPGFDIQQFWTHSLAVSVLSRGIARKCGTTSPDAYLVPGLLHDVGQLVLYLQLPRLMENINQQQKSDAGLINQREEHELGYCHAELGGSLLKYWQLPDNLWEPIYHHHNPLWGHEYAHMSSVLKVSDLMADSYCAESNTVPDILIEIAEPLKFLGLEINDIDLIWETVREDLSDLKLQFRVH